MNDMLSTKTDQINTDRSARYLEEVLLQPEQVDDVALTPSGPDADAESDGQEHPHGDY